MQENKDYLLEIESQLENNKIESFQKENIEYQPKKNISFKYILGFSFFLLILIIGGYFLFFKASISMPNFVGESINDVQSWVRQYDIVNSGVVFKEEYNFDYDKNTIISQSIEPNKMIKEDVKIDFVMSLGPDPKEEIELPNIISLDEEAIRTFIDNNKLLNTKLNIEFSDTIKEHGVIDYNLDDKVFTRGSKLEIRISKGPSPKGQIVALDFVNKEVSNVITWAKDNNILLEIQEEFSNTIGIGLVISQSINVNNPINVNSVFKVKVSKGKAILVPDFTLMSKDQFDIWKLQDDNSSIKFKEKSVYSYDYSKFIINQSIKPNSQMTIKDVIEIEVSIGALRLPNSFIGSSYQSLVDWANSLRDKNTDIYAAQWTNEATYSSTYRKDTILSMVCADSKDNLYDCSKDLPLDLRINVILSKGLQVPISSIDLVDATTMADFLTKNQFLFSTISVDGSVSRLLVNGNVVVDGNYVREGDNIVLEIAKELPDSAP